MGNFREWLSDNLRYILLGLFIILALIAILLGIKFVSSKVNTNDTKDQVSQENPNDQKDSTVEDAEVNSNTEPTSIPEKEVSSGDALEKNTYPEVNAIIQKYYTALGSKDIEGLQNIVDNLDETEQAKIVKDQYLENYSGVEAYTKKGLADGCYIVLARYNYKFKDIDGQVPGLSQLYLCTNEDGSLYISMEQDEETQKYIQDAVQAEDAQKLIKSVQEEYKTVLEANEKLKNFISSLGVATSNASKAEDGSSVIIKGSCNIRAEANEEAEILGELEAGQQVTKRGSDGDWIQIEYDGVTGYVRSDLFE